MGIRDLDLNWLFYNFKYFPASGRDGFDYNPRLIREVVEVRPNSVEMGSAELVFRSSDHDHWGDVEVSRVLGAVYTIGNNTMLPGSVVDEVEQMSFAPYAFMKVDALRSQQTPTLQYSSMVQIQGDKGEAVVLPYPTVSRRKGFGSLFFP